MQEGQLWEKRPEFSAMLGNKGTPKSFESPSALYHKALDYFKWCDEHPMYKTEQVKKLGPPIILDNGTVIPPDPLIEIPIKRPYTAGGFCIFAGVNTRWLATFDQKHRNQGMGITIPEETERWMMVIDFIMDTIKTQQYEGAAAGFFQQNIVARMIGLADKTEIEQRTTEVKEVFKIGEKEFEL